VGNQQVRPAGSAQVATRRPKMPDSRESLLCSIAIKPRRVARAMPREGPGCWRSLPGSFHTRAAFFRDARSRAPALAKHDPGAVPAPLAGRCEWACLAWEGPAGWRQRSAALQPSAAVRPAVQSHWRPPQALANPPALPKRWFLHRAAAAIQGQSAIPIRCRLIAPFRNGRRIRCSQGLQRPGRLAKLPDSNPAAVVLKHCYRFRCRVLRNRRTCG
jgi:hypothetical protein